MKMTAEKKKLDLLRSLCHDEESLVLRQNVSGKWIVFHSNSGMILGTGQTVDEAIADALDNAATYLGLGSQEELMLFLSVLGIEV